MITPDSLLSRVWDLARVKTKPNSRAKCEAEALCLGILTGPRFAHNPPQDRGFYWRHGRWPEQHHAVTKRGCC